MTRENEATSPAPDPIRRGGAGPEGPADRIDTISVGNVLRAVDPEPPVGTEVELHNVQGSWPWKRWKRIPVPYQRPLGMGEPTLAWSWQRITWDGPVTIVWVPAAADVTDYQEHVKLTMWQDAPGEWRPVTWRLAEDDTGS